jgi:flagellar hook assembly protein FlgD
VRLRVYDARGRLVTTLLDSAMPAGTHDVTWAGRNQAGQPAASGVYFYKLEAGGLSLSRRMVLLK